MHSVLRVPPHHDERWLAPRHDEYAQVRGAGGASSSGGHTKKPNSAADLTKTGTLSSTGPNGGGDVGRARGASRRHRQYNAMWRQDGPCFWQRAVVRSAGRSGQENLQRSSNRLQKGRLQCPRRTVAATG